MDVTFYMFFSSFLMSMSAWCVFLWAIRTGQFRNVEETKYQVWPSDDSMDAPNPEPPGR